MGGQRWTFTTSASTTELVARLQSLFARQEDAALNLIVPPEFTKLVNESGFSFVVAPVRGGPVSLFVCAGRFTPSATGTTVEVKLRLVRWLPAIPVAVALLFWAAIVWFLYPVTMALAVGWLVLLQSAVLLFLAISTFVGQRSCRKHIEQLLSAEQIVPSTPEVGPQYPWWELLGAGLFCLVGSAFAGWFVTAAERNGEIDKLPIVASQLYALGGKWLVVGFLVAVGAGFTGAAIAKFFRVRASN